MSTVTPLPRVIPLNDVAPAITALLPPEIEAEAPRPDALGSWWSRVEAKLEPGERLALTRVRGGQYEARTLRRAYKRLSPTRASQSGHGATPIDALAELLAEIEVRDAEHPAASVRPAA
jgi:hypothetical protein